MVWWKSWILWNRLWSRGGWRRRAPAPSGGCVRLPGQPAKGPLPGERGGPEVRRGVASSGPGGPPPRRAGQNVNSYQLLPAVLRLVCAPLQPPSAWSGNTLVLTPLMALQVSYHGLICSPESIQRIHTGSRKTPRRHSRHTGRSARRHTAGRRKGSPLQAYSLFHTSLPLSPASATAAAVAAFAAAAARFRCTRLQVVRCAGQCAVAQASPQ